MGALDRPLERTAIERILPHRHPFLLVDRIVELEPGRRVVGVKNVTHDERFLVRTPGRSPTLPPMILMEAVAQVGAILVLAAPERPARLVFFAGIERARFRRRVVSGDVLTIETRIRRLGSRMGTFEGEARVEGRRVAEGVVSFAFGPERGP